jgi:DNA-binding MarR family transcriptional regulator
MYQRPDSLVNMPRKRDVAVRRAGAPPPAGEGKRGPGGHVGYLLRQAAAAMRRAHDAALAELGLTTPQFLVLNLLDAYPGASGAELARTAQLTPQTMNLVVRKLEDAGLLARTGDERHGRILRVTLTTYGAARLRECKRRSETIERRALALLDATTEAQVRRWLVDLALELGRS